MCDELLDLEPTTNEKNIPTEIVNVKVSINGVMTIIIIDTGTNISLINSI